MSEDREMIRVDVPAMLDALGIEYRQHGTELWAACPHPNHPEKTASWSIGEESGGHHCFGCDWSAGPIGLVMTRIGLSGYSAAHEWLKEKGLLLSGELPLAVKLEIRRPLARQGMLLPPDAVIADVTRWVTPARRYIESRGVTPEQVKNWGLGYAVNGYYAGRVLLPTRERTTGRLLNITGRDFIKAKGPGKPRPKYLNAREEDGWDRSAVFGEAGWPNHPGGETLVLFEGELNALAGERVGVEFFGALGGSQLEKEQVLKLSRFGRIILAVDIDKAGSRIAEQLRATLVRWRRVSRVAFPDKRDPNDLERTDVALLRRLLAAAH